MRGRERELQIAAGFLDAAERGRGGVLLIEGEPGIGKSEILGEVINQAVRRNFSLASAMPFAPLLAALREPPGGPAGQAPRSGTPEAWIPVVDRIRVVANNGDNFRLNPDTGAVAGADTALNPGTPIVVAAA